MFVSEISCALCVNDTFVLLPHLHVHIVVGAQCKREFTISCMNVVSRARIFALIQHHRHIRPFLLSFGHLSKCNQCTLFKSLIQMQIGRIEDTFYEMNLCFMAHSTAVFFFVCILAINFTLDQNLWLFVVTEFPCNGILYDQIDI